jgi:hypothetical protein
LNIALREIAKYEAAQKEAKITEKDITGGLRISAHSRRRLRRKWQGERIGKGMNEYG